MADYKTHVNEAIGELGQYLACVAASIMIGWGEGIFATFSTKAGRR